jgi:hypothetical protein
MGYTSEPSPLGMNVSKLVGGLLCPKAFLLTKYNCKGDYASSNSTTTS